MGLQKHPVDQMSGVSSNRAPLAKCQMIPSVLSPLLIVDIASCLGTLKVHVRKLLGCV